MRAYDEEAGAEFGLTDLAEDSDDDSQTGRVNGNTNANGKSRGHNEIEMQPQRSHDR